MVYVFALRFTAGVSAILKDREASIIDLLGILDVLLSWFGVRGGKHGYQLDAQRVGILRTVAQVDEWLRMKDVKAYRGMRP